MYCEQCLINYGFHKSTKSFYEIMTELEEGLRQDLEQRLATAESQRDTYKRLYTSVDVALAKEQQRRYKVPSLRSRSRDRS